MTTITMNAESLSKILERSIEEKKIRETERMEQKRMRHEEFIGRLKESCEDFMKEMEKEVMDRLLSSVHRGNKLVRFRASIDFDQSFGCVKVSTMVYGWRDSKNHEWNTKTFEEIGIKEGMTPFAVVIDHFKEQGIIVKNISDRRRGLGFWIEASF